jgi:Txe/YoeB family toxin of Txe-Axe toxin-antitoxin module
VEEITEAKIEDIAKILVTNERIAEKIVELAKKLKKTNY